VITEGNLFRKILLDITGQTLQVTLNGHSLSLVVDGDAKKCLEATASAHDYF
jgi:hypothetical protein